MPPKKARRLRQIRHRTIVKSLGFEAHIAIAAAMVTEVQASPHSDERCHG
jgi:hypothetical protein